MVRRLRLVLIFGLAAVAGAVVAIPAAATGHANSSHTAGDLGIVAGTMRAVEAGPATAGPLAAQGVAVDSSGNVYIADTLNNDIEKVTPSGTLSIIAGTGTRGTPTPGPATSSALNQPSGVAVDSSGNVYIADTDNNEIEKVTPLGTLSIIAGTGSQGTPTAGPATSSALNQPAGVAVDSSGDVYIADTRNSAVEKVSDGTLSIVAGTPGNAGRPTAGSATSSQLGQTQGVAVDSSGNVYIADAGNDVIEEISGGTLSIIAGVVEHSGTPTPGPATSSDLDFPVGVAVDSSGDVYIADRSAQEIEEVVPSGTTTPGTLSIIAGTGTEGTPTAGPATSSDLGRPSAVAVDSDGNVYIGDPQYDVVEKVAGGQLSIFAGTGSQGTPTPGVATSSELHAPSGVAVDSSGNVYIADTTNEVVEKVTPSGMLSIIAGNGTEGAPTAGPARSSDLSNPVGVAVDSSGNVYIAGGDFGGSNIVKVTPTGALSIIASGSELGEVQGIAVDGSGDLYVSERSPTEVVKFTVGSTTPVVIAGTGTFGAPTPGPATSSKLGDPEELAVDSGGNVYITDTSSDEVYKVTPAVAATPGTLSIIAGTGSDESDDSVARAATPGVAATSTSLGDPSGVAVDSSGNVYIADSGDDEIDKVTGGQLSVIAGTGIRGLPTPGPATSSKLGGPFGIAVDGSDDVYIADYGNDDVEEVFGTTTGTGTGTGTTGTGTGTTTTTPPTTTPPVARVTAVHAKAATTTVAIKCSGKSSQTCTTTVTLTTSYKVRVGHRTRTKTVTIATATVTVKGGKSRIVTISLNRAGDVLLKHDKKLTATLVVKQGKHTIKTQPVRLAAPQRKR